MGWGEPLVLDLSARPGQVAVLALMQGKPCGMGRNSEEIAWGRAQGECEGGVAQPQSGCDRQRAGKMVYEVGA